MLPRFNLAQRIILVVALGVALWTVGTYATGPRLVARGGFAPLTTPPTYLLDDPGWHPVPAAMLWIALILVWAAASVWLLGPPRRSGE